MNCPVCKNKFEPNTGRRPKRFCSNACKVKFWNAQKKVANNNKPENKKRILEERNGKNDFGGKNSKTQPLSPTEVTKTATKFKVYDYSAMPQGLLHAGREAWKKKAREEQDKNTK